MNIALTDDMPEERESIQRILADYAAANRIRIDVSAFESAEELLRSYRPLQYTAVFLDIYMDGMSGIDTLARIREMPKISGIRTIVLTSSSQTMDMTEAFRLGVLEFIRKPALPEKLCFSVWQALRVQGKDKILAVDDDEMCLLTIEMMFGTRYDVRSASSGQEALEELAREKPDLVLLDLRMPGMDGLEVLARIRDMEGYEDLPVVFLTADRDVDVETAIFTAGATDFIAKPLVMQVAMQRLRRILEHKHLRDSLYEKVMQQRADGSGEDKMKEGKKE